MLKMSHVNWRLFIRGLLFDRKLFVYISTVISSEDKLGTSYNLHRQYNTKSRTGLLPKACTHPKIALNFTTEGRLSLQYLPKQKLKYTLKICVIITVLEIKGRKPTGESVWILWLRWSLLMDPSRLSTYLGGNSVHSGWTWQTRAVFHSTSCLFSGAACAYLENIIVVQSSGWMM